MKGRKKGRKKTGGRKKGSLNKVTVSAKEGIEYAYSALDGSEGLLNWVKKDPKNEEIFWSKIFLKLVPNDLNLGGQKDNPVQTEIVDKTAINIDERIKELIRLRKSGSESA